MPPSSSPADGIATRVVSLPSWDRLARARAATYRDELFPPGVPVLSVEAGDDVRLGRVRRRLDRDRPLRRQRTRRRGARRLGINVDHVVETARALVGRTTERRTREGVAMERLIRLYEEFGQSPWLDNLKRGYLTSGQLAELRDGGIRGLTSNPTIFQKAISDSTDYDEQFRELAGRRRPDRRRLLGARHCRTSSAPATCSTRCTSRATAVTASSASRSRPSLAHDGRRHRGRRPRPARARSPAAT